MDLRNMKNLVLMSVVLLSTVSSSLYAQDQGEIPNVEIVIEKNRHGRPSRSNLKSPTTSRIFHLLRLITILPFDRIS
jgi:hypothetical protein